MKMTKREEIERRNRVLKIISYIMALIVLGIAIYGLVTVIIR